MNHRHEHSSHTPEQVVSGRLTRDEGDATVARRRTLLRAAASSAPFLAGLAPNAALAQGSAFRAATMDGTIAPAAATDTHDGWMRAPARYGRVTVGQGANSATVYPNVIFVGNAYYTVDVPFDVGAKGTLVTLTNGQTFQDGEAVTKLVLVLFGKLPGNGYGEAGKWPQFAYPELDARFESALQGLHCSSWTSAAGGGAPPYQCSGV